MIKDSGDRMEFQSGAVRDMHEGKGRLDLLPCSAIIELAKHCFKYLRGDNDENHLVAALWNIAWAVNQEVEKPEMQDLPSRIGEPGGAAEL